MVLSAMPMSSRALSSCRWCRRAPSCRRCTRCRRACSGRDARADVRSQMHARRVEPAEERFACRLLALHEIDGRGRRLIVDRLHALLGERAGVLDRLLADLAEARIDRRIVDVGCLALKNAARAELGAISRVLGIIGQLRLFLGVEVIEIAEELIEAVDCRQRLDCDRRRGSCRTGPWHSRGS